MMTLSAPILRQISTEPIKIDAGKDVELKFKWTGQPEPVISWSRNKAKIQPSVKYETLGSNDEFVLIIRDVSKSVNILFVIFRFKKTMKVITN